MVARALSILWRVTYARYVMASALALGVDLGLFITLLNMGMPPVPASAAGYAFGLLIHWMASVRIVFTQQPMPFLSRRRRQKLLFVASALVGLAITGTIVGIGSHLGLDPRLAKLAAIAVAFQTTYILRRTVVFG
ncbi:MAG: GtrA family protein [Sphingobium sp.]